MDKSTKLVDKSRVRWQVVLNEFFQSNGNLPAKRKTIVAWIKENYPLKVPSLGKELSRRCHYGHDRLWYLNEESVHGEKYNLLKEHIRTKTAGGQTAADFMSLGRDGRVMTDEVVQAIFKANGVLNRHGRWIVGKKYKSRKTVFDLPHAFMIENEAGNFRLDRRLWYFYKYMYN